VIPVLPTKTKIADVSLAVKTSALETLI